MSSDASSMQRITNPLGLTASLSAYYSVLSAVMGEMDAATLAGIRAAMAAHIASAPVATANARLYIEILFESEKVTSADRICLRSTD
jgi:methionine salvage enolase-phosphatase E1